MLDPEHLMKIVAATSGPVTAELADKFRTYLKLTYLIVSIGLMTFAPGTPTDSLGTVHLMWLVAFLAGFSDRFSDSLLRSLIGKFGGDKDGDIVSMEMTTQSQKSSSFESLLSFLGRRKQEQPDAHAVADGNGKAVPAGAATTTRPAGGARPHRQRYAGRRGRGRRLDARKHGDERQD